MTLSVITPGEKTLKTHFLKYDLIPQTGEKSYIRGEIFLKGFEKVQSTTSNYSVAHCK